MVKFCRLFGYFHVVVFALFIPAIYDLNGDLDWKYDIIIGIAKVANRGKVIELL